MLLSRALSHRAEGGVELRVLFWPKGTVLERGGCSVGVSSDAKCRTHLLPVEAGYSVGPLRCAPRWRPLHRVSQPPNLPPGPQRRSARMWAVSSSSMVGVPGRREMAFPALPRRGWTGFELRFCATSAETAQTTPGESKSEPGGPHAGLGHHPPVRRTRSGDAAGSFLEKQHALTVGFRALWAGGHRCLHSILLEDSRARNEPRVDVSSIRAGLGCWGGRVPRVGDSSKRLACPSWHGGLTQPKSRTWHVPSQGPFCSLSQSLQS